MLTRRLRRVFPLCIVALPFAFSTLPAQVDSGAGRRFLQSQEVTVAPTGAPAVLDRVARSTPPAISLTTTRLIGGGTPSLVTGYALAQGGVVAIQRGTLGEHGSHDPFAASASLVEVGLRPDFVQVADLNNDGAADLIVASRGGSSMQVLFGDHAGFYSAQPIVQLGGSIQALTSWRAPSGMPLIAALTCSGSCAIELYRRDGVRFASLPVEGDASILETGGLERGSALDLIVGGASGLFLVSGESALSSTPQITRLPIAGAVSAATGIFVYDRRNFPQIAVLTADGSLHTLARTGLEATPLIQSVDPSRRIARGHALAGAPLVFPSPARLGWYDAEVLPAVVTLDSAVPARVLRTRLSGGGTDDLVVLNANGGHLTSVRHPLRQVDATEAVPAHFEPLAPSVAVESFTTAGVQAAVAERVNPSGGLGLITIDGTPHPQLSPLPANKTLYVGTNSDSAPTTVQMTTCTVSINTTCTLRAAIAVANADGKSGNTTADTINLPAGTYTLSYSPSGTARDGNGNYGYHIEVTANINLIGTGNPVITAANKDKALSINSGYTGAAQVPLDIYISGVTFSNNSNLNNSVVNAFSNYVGGAIDFETSGTGNLTFNNVAFTNNVNIGGAGGAVYVSDGFLFSGATGNPGPGTLEVDNSTFTGNLSIEDGGAIFAGYTENPGNVPILISGSTFTCNQSSNTGYVATAGCVTPTNSQSNTADTAANQEGGALAYPSDNQTSVTSTVTNSTFTNNRSFARSGNNNANGGGVFAGSGLKIIGSTFTGNTSTNGGGGLYEIAIYQTPAITGSTFTGNTSGYAGGILLENTGNLANPGPLTSTIQYNRITGNTGAPTGLAVNRATDSTTVTFPTVTASENFWGCNGDPQTSPAGCDVAKKIGTGTLTTVPYAVVTASLNSATPAAGSTLTLTGALNKDSNGTALSTLTAFTGLPITLTLTQNGSTLASANSTTTATGDSASSLSFTVTASGPGTGTAKVDNGTGSASFNVTIAPPSASLSFGASSIPVGGTTTLSIVLTNSNAVALNGVAVADSLPSGLVVATPPGATSNCGGTFSLTAGSSSFSLSGGALSANASCTLTVNVTGTTAGTKNDSTGGPTATNASSSGVASNVATLVVNTPVTLAVTFAQPRVPPGSTQAISYTLTNPNPAPQSNVGFDSTLPSGFTVASPVSLFTTCSGGSVTAASGSNTVRLTGSSLAANTSCVLQVNINEPITPGTYTVSGTPSSNEGGTGVAASGVVVVADSIWLLEGNGTRAQISELGVLQISPVNTAVPVNLFGDIAIEPTVGARQSANSANGGIAIDNAGGVWSVASNQSTLRFINKSASGAAIYSGGGLNLPYAVAIDGAGSVWVANNGNASVSQFTPLGVAVTPPAGYPTVGSGPSSIAIDISGNVWVADQSSNAVTRILGAAAPVVSPLSVGVANLTLGSQP